jgi:hypothetical protein
MRFHQGRDVIDLPPGVAPEGLEFSPAMKTFLLGSGAVLYASLISLVVAIHATNNARSHGDPRLEFVADGQEQGIVPMQHEMGAVKVERRAAYRAPGASSKIAG